MLFTTRWLSSIFTKYDGEAPTPIPIDEVKTDSRKEMRNALFIPLSGEKFDGHDHVQQAFANGAAAILWEKSKDLPDIFPANFPVFFVDNTLKALQQLAAAYRKEINPVVIGITGSNGKTTTKDIVAAVAGSKYKTHHTKGNYNNHIGLPLTILSMARDTEVIVLEMGMSSRGEIEKLSEIACPDYAVITNIGESHIEFLGSREEIANAKLEIRKGMSEYAHLIIDGDERLLRRVRDLDNVTTCGFEAGNNLVIKNTSVFEQHSVFELSDGHTYTIPLLGKHHALNATFAIALGKQLGIATKEIKAALQQLTLTSMRFEMLTGINNVSIINDAYNASPTSMKASIEVVRQMAGFNEKVLILGDILELGDYAQTFHESVADVISDPITAVLTIGKDAKYISDKVKQNHPSIACMHLESKDALLRKLQDYETSDSLLLFKASRGMQLESLVEAIQQNGN